MKGIVFSEFIEMVENQFSLEMADAIIARSNLATGGAYSAIATYDHLELVELVERLGEASGVPVADLLRSFGEYLFARFAMLYPVHFTHQSSVFQFLSTLESKIHAEVRKLYPDAELPTFEHAMPAARTLQLLYRSRRPFGDLAEGLLLGCIRHYREDIRLQRENLPCGNGASVRFTLEQITDGADKTTSRTET